MERNDVVGVFADRRRDGSAGRRWCAALSPLGFAALVNALRADCSEYFAFGKLLNSHSAALQAQPVRPSTAARLVSALLPTALHNSQCALRRRLRMSGLVEENAHGESVGVFKSR